MDDTDKNIRKLLNIFARKAGYHDGFHLGSENTLLEDVDFDEESLQEYKKAFQEGVEDFVIEEYNL